MTPLKSYLIRAIYEWTTDNGLTPHLLVNAEYPNTDVPQQFIENGKIILNIRPQAVQSLSLGNEEISFDTRFSGKSTHITIPTGAVLAIYAQENAKGMVFDHEDDTPPPEKKPPTKPALRIVK